MSDEHFDRRRRSFGQVAELYEQARPTYPQPLIDDVLAYGGVEPGEAILDVGAGTGKATRLFAARGYRVVALEPSAEMAAVARRTLAGFPSVEIVEDEFERWPSPAGAFRLLISAQAWHWTDPDLRYARARAALQTGGALAAFWNHPDWARSSLRAELDEAYRETAPQIERGDPMRPATDREDLAEGWEGEIADAEGFGDPEVRHYTWHLRYTSEEYVRLLATTSEHVLLDAAVRDALLGRIAAVIDRHGGAVQLPLFTRLCLARAV